LGNGGVRNLAQLVQGLHEAALAVQYGGDDGDDAADHDDALDEIVDGGGHVAAGDDIDGGENGHHDDAHAVINVKGHAEQAGEAIVQRGGIGDQENENDGRSGSLELGAVEAPREELGHGGAVQVLGHDAGAPAQEGPCHQRAQKRVANAGPGGGNAVFPAELAGIANENHRREIAGAIGESCEPGTHAASAQDEAVHVGGMFAAVQTNTNGHCEENDEHTDFDDQIHVQFSFRTTSATLSAKISQ